jgi:alkanesulfonate monooxygenase SsuD/methylene tetrahydromethanopterin reductase-like flavin-dependent oxidoreductase (luciferase family)
MEPIRRPEDVSNTKDTLKYYTNLAKLAEKGKISAIFFADWYAGFDVYGGSMDAMLSAGHQVAHLDPLPIVSAMAAVTESVAFAVTMSTSYVNPYVLARQFSTLDHLTGGRCAWNIVTSWSKSAANALGQEDVVPHDERYAVADEYMDVTYKYANVQRMSGRIVALTLLGYGRAHGAQTLLYGILRRESPLTHQR